MTISYPDLFHFPKTYLCEDLYSSFPFPILRLGTLKASLDVPH